MPNKAKKFALIGTSCIGKTTLLNELQVIIPQKLDKKVVISPEAARYYFSTVRVRNPFSFYNQSAVQQLARKLEMDAEKTSPDIILCDRSVFDAVAYVHAVGREEDAKKLYDRMKDWLMTYDHLFLLDPKDVPYKTDAIRKEPEEVRQMFHESFLTLLSNSELPFSVISGKEEKRISAMLTIINQNYEKK